MISCWLFVPDTMPYCIDLCFRNLYCRESMWSQHWRPEEQDNIQFPVVIKDTAISTHVWTLWMLLERLRLTGCFFAQESCLYRNWICSGSGRSISHKHYYAAVFCQPHPRIRWIKPKILYAGSGCNRNPSLIQVLGKRLWLRNAMSWVSPGSQRWRIVSVRSMLNGSHLFVEATLNTI